jgi:hypothetical protein
VAKWKRRVESYEDLLREKVEALNATEKRAGLIAEGERGKRNRIDQVMTRARGQEYGP